MIRIALTLIACLLAAGTAEAKPRHARAHHHARMAHHHTHVRHLRAAHNRAEPDVPHASGLGPRPGRWCGWWMRSQLGGGPRYNLAWEWSRWGHASEPAIGAVVVWPHHVGMITGQAANGRWIVKSGNDGGRVRERPRSVRGAVFRAGPWP